MRFAIIKCHGSGNDFPLIDARDIALDSASWARVARALADRAGPVGGDGLLLLDRARDGAAFAMRMFNSDGSEAETCLNGLRCVARLGFERLGLERATVALKTSVAEVVAERPIAPGVFTVRETAGPADLAIARWPMRIDRDRNVERPIAALPGGHAFTAVAMPNPHLVAFVDTIDEAALIAIGEVCEAAPDWLPNRANVSFVEVRGADLFVRTYERGVGLTDSCGSAMAASIYAAGLTGRIAFDVERTVFNRGGLVRASADAAGMVTLAGNATFEWSGSVEVLGEVAGDLHIDVRYDAEVAAWDALLATIG